MSTNNTYHKPQISLWGLFFLLMFSGVLAARPYAKLIKTHSFESCHYYDVVIYDDQGTMDIEDDIEVAKAVVRDCKHDLCLLVKYIDVYAVKELGAEDCKLYEFEIQFNKGVKLKGVATSDACEG